MSYLNIQCPHCGFSKNVERQRIPAGVKNMKCPKCQQAFALEPGEETASAPKEAAASLQPSQPGGGASAPAPDHSQPQRAGEGGVEPLTQFKFCSTCGQKVHIKAEICPKCGIRVAPKPDAINKVALLFITFFLGGLGAHKLYQKKYLLAALYFLFFWTYIPALVAFVEFIIYACKSEAELQQRYPEASSGVLIFAVIIPFVGIAMIGILAAIAIPQFAAYREKALSAGASNDLKSCKAQTEAYFAEYKAYPTEAGQLQCQASKDVALYYLSLGPDEYQLISFHDRGRKAFLNNSSGPEIDENTREEIEKQIEEKYGSSALERTFHFIE